MYIGVWAFVNYKINCFLFNIGRIFLISKYSAEKNQNQKNRILLLTYMIIGIRVWISQHFTKKL